jgi:hypothetical protein
VKVLAARAFGDAKARASAPHRRRGRTPRPRLTPRTSRNAVRDRDRTSRGRTVPVRRHSESGGVRRTTDRVGHRTECAACTSPSSRPGDSRPSHAHRSSGRASSADRTVRATRRIPRAAHRQSKCPRCTTRDASPTRRGRTSLARPLRIGWPQRCTWVSRAPTRTCGSRRRRGGRRWPRSIFDAPRAPPRP